MYVFTSLLLDLLKIINCCEEYILHKVIITVDVGAYVTVLTH